MSAVMWILSRYVYNIHTCPHRTDPLPRRVRTSFVDGPIGTQALENYI